MSDLTSTLGKIDKLKWVTQRLKEYKLFIITKMENNDIILEVWLDNYNPFIDDLNELTDYFKEHNE